MPPTTQTRKIVISVDTSGAAGLKDIADKLGGINKNTKDLAKGFGAMNAAATTFLGGLSIRELASFSDNIQNLNNRLLSMSGSQSEATKTLNALVGVSRDTNQSLDAISESYFRMSGALKDVGISQGTLIDTTKTIANTFRLSGASTQEATNATIQLGQAFSLGVLRGQDLRSVMSQNLVLTRLLRKEFGNNLLKSAEAGLITVPKLMEILHKNMKAVNEQAKLMSATFEQSTTKAIDAFKLKIYDLSTALDLPGKFAKGVQFTIDNMGKIVTVGTIVALVTLPAITTSVYALASSLGLLNPLTLGLAAGLVAVTVAFGDSFDITSLIKQMEIGFANLQVMIDNSIGKFYEIIVSIKKFVGDSAEGFDKLATAARQSAKDHEVHARALRIEKEAMEALAEAQRNGTATAGNFAADMKKLDKAFPAAEKTVKQMLEALNKEFNEGKINAGEYNEAILKFDMDAARKKFKDGKIDLNALNAAFNKVEVLKLNREFKDGLIPLDEFNSRLRALKLKDLQRDLESGKISLSDYNSKLAEVSDKFTVSGAFRTGLQDYLTALGTTTQQVAGAIKTAFTGLEDVFVNFVKNGKFEFDKFTQAVLDDLTRIIVRATIIQPLATGILSAIASPAAAGTGVQATNSNYSNVAAKGAYFDHGLARFAKGGIVNRPTAFGYGNKKTGLMGEAGPEAILPLARGSGGQLGVAASVTPVNINIINNSSAETSQKESTGPNGEKTIDILITNKVREGLASGSYDKMFHQNYGLRRKGS